MKGKFKATSSFARSVFAAAAIVTPSLAGVVDGQATHDASNGPQRADQTVASAPV